MKYIIKFKKEGKIRFISHLDLMKVFLRLFRIIGIKPRYSNGFNPHPKLSFALPLSLGFASVSEYLELETESEEGFNTEEVLNKLSSHLPDGLNIDYIKEKPTIINKKLASYIDCAEYQIHSPSFESPKKNIASYIKQKEIIYDKHSRKTGKTKEINIKPSILKFDFIDDSIKLSDMANNNYVTLTCLLHAGNDSVLNPNVLMESFFKYINQSFDNTQLSITRTKTYCKVNNRILDVDDLFE